MVRPAHGSGGLRRGNILWVAAAVNLLTDGSLFFR